jgi:hypothetical protein
MVPAPGNPDNSPNYMVYKKPVQLDERFNKKMLLDPKTIENAANSGLNMLNHRYTAIWLVRAKILPGFSEPGGFFRNPRLRRVSFTETIV